MDISLTGVDLNIYYYYILYLLKYPGWSLLCSSPFCYPNSGTKMINCMASSHQHNYAEDIIISAIG